MLGNITHFNIRWGGSSMYIVNIRAKIQTVCMASEIWYGEIELSRPKGGPLYVTLLRDEDDISHYSVSKESVYDYWADISDKSPKLAEEYSTWTQAKTSTYADYFKILKRILKDFNR